MHRPIPDGFKIKTAIISRKADGWYVTLAIQDDTVPNVIPKDDALNTVGIDMGLKSFLVKSDSSEVAIPQYYRKAFMRLKKAQKAVSRRKGALIVAKRLRSWVKLTKKSRTPAKTSILRRLRAYSIPMTW